MFMDFLGYGNHVALYSEEISRGGEGLGVSDLILQLLGSNRLARSRTGKDIGC